MVETRGAPKRGKKKKNIWVNAFTTGNPFWGQNYLDSTGRGSGALKGLKG